jgi:hypothetical protein
MIYDELQTFSEQNGLPHLTISDDGVAWAELPNIGHLVVDTSVENCPCMYLLTTLERMSLQSLLEGLRICDPLRTIGEPINFIADEKNNVGFVVKLDDNKLYARTFGEVCAQLLQALTKLQQNCLGEII